MGDSLVEKLTALKDAACAHVLEGEAAPDWKTVSVALAEAAGEIAALRTAEARIAELESALGRVHGMKHSDTCSQELVEGCDCDCHVSIAEAALTGSSDYLARRDREVRKKALREAAEIARVRWVSDPETIEPAILALIEKEEPRDG